MAPMSRAWVASQMMCDASRCISASIMRIQAARGGRVTPSSFSTAPTNAWLLAAAVV